MSARLTSWLTVIAVATLLAAGPGAQQKHVSSEQTPAAAPSGLVVGRVLDAVTNRPIARAVVTMVAPQVVSPALEVLPGTRVQPSNTAPRVFTDAEGRFLFRDLAAGSYTFIATAGGYLEGGYGQRRPNGAIRSFALAEAQRTGDVTIRLWPEATITGRVSDESGAPIPSVWVSLLPREIAPSSSSWRSSSTQGARTDDRGNYRFTNLIPGEYVVCIASQMTQWPIAFASLDATALLPTRATGLTGIAPNATAIRLGDVAIQTWAEGSWGGSNNFAAMLPISMQPDGSVTGYVTTFHPGATTISAATPIKLAPGDDRSGVDIQLRPMSLTRVSGTLTGPNGPIAGSGVHLFPAFAANQMLERTHETAVATTDASGRFAFLGVPAGTYVLKAWSLPQILVIARDPLPADTTLWAEMPVTVGDAPVRDLTVTMRPGVLLSGKIRFEGSATPPMPVALQTPISVAFEPAWPLAFGARLAARVTPAFEFSMQGLPRGSYVPNLPNNFVLSMRGWYFESATRQGQDLQIVPLDVGTENITDIEITFSDKRSELSGIVTDANGRTDPAAAVVVFPADYRTWMQKGLSPYASRSTTVAQNGSFSLAVRPGEYLVAAIDDDSLASWPQAATVEAIARTAVRVTIARGQSARADLKRGAR